MKCRTTIKLKLQRKRQLLDLCESYHAACQYATDRAFLDKVTTKYNLHNLIYYEMREKFPLKSQFIINAIAKGFEAYKSCKKRVVFKSVPIRFDRRTFTFRADSVRLTTNEGRLDVPINVAEYYWRYLDWRYQTADLIINKTGLFLNVTFAKEVPTPTIGGTTVGVDLGINNLAVCSDGQVFKGHKTRIIQHQFLRKRLQRKGTKSAKRKLKAISGRQKRYMRWVNHNVSKQIVASADVIALEDLKGIRKNRKGKRFNRWLNSWTFFQLRQFIEYKAKVAGKTVKIVNPYLTSQKCSNCGKLGSRYFDSFTCPHCDFSSQSDLNASYNLRRLIITQPNSSCDDVKGQLITATEHRAKYPAL